jgi:3-hydroxyisobutyrate dehydrogenase
MQIASSEQVTLGFIGLGIMGGAMARNLRAAGHRLAVYNRSADALSKFADVGARVCGSAAEVAECSDYVFISVSNDRSLEEVVLGSKGLLSASRRPKIIVDFSTVTPGLAVDICQACLKKNVSFLDAPVSGGDVGARDGTLTIMAGGDPSALDELAPYLKTIARKIVHTGGPGTGQMTKCVNQVMVALGVAAMTEGLSLATKFGLDLQKTLEITGSGAAGSWSLNNYAPRLLRNDFGPGFKAEHMVKDLEISLKEAARFSAELPVTELVADLYRTLCERHPNLLGNHALLKLYNASEDQVDS